MKKEIKIISFSLYGNKSIYDKGAIINAKLASKIYPGWIVRIYCGRDIVCKKELKELGCQIIDMPYSRIHSGMFWRFLAAWDKKASRVIFRDLDSRLNVKEAAAVKAWEKSRMIAHAMHDHPHHCNLPFLGGMWGIKVPFLPLEMKDIVELMGRRPQRRIKDMRFLNENVYPLVQDSTLRHSSQILKKWNWKKFPKHSKFKGFVGQQYGENEKPIWPEVK